MLAKFQSDGSILIRVPVGSTDDEKKLHAQAFDLIGRRLRGETVDLAVALAQPWNESKVHRGQPGNPGQFGHYAGGHAEHGEGALRKKHHAPEARGAATRTVEGIGAAGGKVGGQKVAGTSIVGPIFAPDPTKSTRQDGVADAARVGVPAFQVPPPPPIGRLPNLEPDQRKAESDFNLAYQKNPEKFVGEYMRAKNNLVGFKVELPEPKGSERYLELKKKIGGKQATPEEEQEFGTLKEHRDNAQRQGIGPLQQAAEAAGIKVKIDDKDPGKASLSGSMDKLKAFHQSGATGNAKVEHCYEIGDAPNIFNTDDCKMLSPVYNPPADKGVPKDKVFDNRSQYNTALHGSANAISKKAFLKFLDEDMQKLPPEKRTVLVTSGGVASGKGYALGRVSAVNSVAQQAGAIWDAAGEACGVENPWILDECKKRGIKPTFVFVHSDPTKTWENPERGVVERAQKIGRMVNARSFAESYTLGAQNFHNFHQANKDDAQFFILDNTGKEPKVLDQVPQAAMELDTEALNKRCVEYLQNADVKPAVKRGGLDSERMWPSHQSQPA